MTKLKIICAIGALAVLSACATYANIRQYERNYTYEGTTYAVWTANKTSGGRTIRGFMLQDLDDMPNGFNSLAECTSGDIRTCEMTFGAVLKQFSTPKPGGDEGGMGY